MTDPFHDQIQKALANPNLQAALDANAERRIKGKDAANASLPEDLQVMRRRAHAVRADTITNLDRYLQTFIAKAEENGMIVHRAANAADAVRIVLEIARQKGAKLVSKSKTMVGEEIEINHALEAEGLRVVETDLGEYIVQLRQERPAHIITPAVHLQRADVGQTFHEKLGIPFTKDVPVLTGVARRILRQTFLDTDIGISGVNFGVAESGTLCIVTNEGNGRMVTTLPPVHIALMGVERLAPTLDDLALMLYLLPRHATGQKITVYTQLINGPRREGEVDGAGERHLVLVDNGRLSLRSSPLEESLYCIRCGACMNACPVFREIGGHAYVGMHGESTPYPGPIGSVVAPGLFGGSEFGQLARASSLCGACKEACPVDIDLPKLLLRVRAGGAPAAPKGEKPQGSPVHVPTQVRFGLRLYTWAATSPRRFAAVQRAAAFGARLLAPFSGWLRLPAASGWGLSRDIPRPAAQTFHERWRSGKVGSQPSASPSFFQTEPGEASTPAPSQNQPEKADLTKRFQDELTALGGHFYLTSNENIAARLLDWLKKNGVERLLSWDQAHLPDGLLQAIRDGGVEVKSEPDPSAQAGLTGALAGIAETGTLLLSSGVGRASSASLLPEVHLAIIKKGDILARLPEALQLPHIRHNSTSVLISGPSRTADIEMTLTIGVHGPKEVHVFCLAD